MYFSIIRNPKGTALCQDASFEPSTFNIGPGVRPVEVFKNKTVHAYIHIAWILNLAWRKKAQTGYISRMCRVPQCTNSHQIFFPV